jgi:hypothetical protein
VTVPVPDELAKRNMLVEVSTEGNTKATLGGCPPGVYSSTTTGTRIAAGGPTQRR